MSRKITDDAIEAFLARKNFKRANTEVEVFGPKDATYLSLHGNMIARMENGQLEITTAGWDTVTTKERLNGFPGVQVYHEKKVMHLNGKPWDGKWIVPAS